MTRLTWEPGMNLHNILILCSYLLLVMALLLGLPWSLGWPGLLTFPIGIYQIWQMRQIANGVKPNWKVLNFTATGLKILSPVPVSHTEKVYRTIADEFELSVIDMHNNRPHINCKSDSVQILLCTEGKAVVSRETAPGNIGIRKGACLLIKAVAGAFQVKGEATLYKAAVPEKS